MKGVPVPPKPLSLHLTLERVRFFGVKNSRYHSKKMVRQFLKLRTTNLYKLAEFPRKTIYEK